MVKRKIFKSDFESRAQALACAQVRANVSSHAFVVLEVAPVLAGYGPWVIRLAPNDPAARYGEMLRGTIVEPEAWGDLMARAYELGRQDGFAFLPQNLELAAGFDACYTQGYEHGVQERQSQLDRPWHS
jgi:hypothetical protein